ERLTQIRELSENAGYAKRLNKRDFDYIAGCTEAEQQRRVRARLTMALVGALVTCIIAIAGLSYAGILDQTYLKIRARKFLDTYVPTVLTAEQERVLKPGDRFEECASCPEMVVIRAGEFMMGAHDGAKPVHKVTIARKFAVARFTITFDEWEGCVAHNGCPPLDYSAVGRGKQPVIQVNWKA